MILFERRHEAERVSFDNLTDFVEKLKSFWSKSLTNPVQDTRLARWLVTYLIELGVNTDYNEILQVVRGDFEEVAAVSVSEELDLVEDDVKFYIGEDRDYHIKGTKRTICTWLL